MAQTPRKKSPRAPSVALDEAIEHASKIYQKERRHPTPTDVVAQDLGYKGANNGSALSLMASLRYYGLLERPKEGHLAVSKDVEAYQYAPSDQMRRDLLLRWIKSPQVFLELLDKYDSGLPSDANLRFDLIQRGFSPGSAESVISAFKRSVEFARYYEKSPLAPESPGSTEFAEAVEPTRQEDAPRQPMVDSENGMGSQDSDLDRIPVRLSKGRRAWLVIPSPFFVADKKRLKAQIDLLLTDDEEQAQ